MDCLAPVEIIIARHGNTFNRGDTVLRCGARTDLPLSSSGRDQAKALGNALGRYNPVSFAAVYVSTLQRTRETAQIALAAMGQSMTLTLEPLFDEIDYGPDEGRPETDVLARLGAAALAAWDEDAIVPPGWQCDSAAMRLVWKNFCDRILANGDRRVLVVTSNGIGRFALANTADFKVGGKLNTGAYGVLAHIGGTWRVRAWNVRPALG